MITPGPLIDEMMEMMNISIYISRYHYSIHYFMTVILFCSVLMTHQTGTLREDLQGQVAKTMSPAKTQPARLETHEGSD